MLPRQQKVSLIHCVRGTVSDVRICRDLVFASTRFPDYIQRTLPLFASSLTSTSRDSLAHHSSPPRPIVPPKVQIKTPNKIGMDHDDIPTSSTNDRNRYNDTKGKNRPTPLKLNNSNHLAFLAPLLSPLLERPFLSRFGSASTSSSDGIDSGVNSRKIKPVASVSSVSLCPLIFRIFATSTNHHARVGKMF